MKYFIADTHFGHTKILSMSKRPFDTISDHDAALIKNWNNVVKKDDEIYILGDFAMSTSGYHVSNILKRLNGRKYLIKGNHDKYLDDPDFDHSVFEWEKDYHTFNYRKRKFVLCHYPILEWEGFYRGAVHLYGHVHNNNRQFFDSVLDKRAANVGVDVIGFTPVSIDSILTKITK